MRRAPILVQYGAPRPCLFVGRSISRKQGHGACAHLERSTARTDCGPSSLIAAWTGKAFDQPAFHRIRNHNENNRSCRGRGFRSIGRRWRGSDKDIEIELRQLGGHGFEALRLFRRKAMLKDDVLPFDVSELSDAFHKRLQENRFLRGAASVPKNADPCDLPRLLCARRERPRRRAGDERDELAPFHSITSSARACSV